MTAPQRLAPFLVSHPLFHRPRHRDRHPLAIERVGPVVEIAEAMGWLDATNYREIVPVADADLLRFHTEDYLAALKETESAAPDLARLKARFNIGTVENPLIEGIYQRVQLLGGAAALSTRLALEGRTVFQPAGGTHHGRPDRASGFCYTNDAVFAILDFRRQGCRRIAYLDFDAHHGDGVEDAVGGDEDVLCISVHQEGRWPGTGVAHGPSIHNFPVQREFDDNAFTALVDTEILPRIRSFAPDALVILSGADSLKGDALMGLALTNRCLTEVVAQATMLAPAAVILGGGGYNPWNAVRYWTSLWAHLNGFPIPDPLPDAVRAVLARLKADRIPARAMQPDWLTSLVDAGSA